MSTRADCDTPRRPYLVGVNVQHKVAVFFRPRCKMWNCPVCGPINRGRWIARTYQGAVNLVSEGYSLNFLTLTSHERLKPESTIVVFRTAWDKLNKRVRRVAPGYQYILIPEQHQDGRLHAHLIETSGLGTRWFKDNGRQCGLGYMAEETPVQSPEGAAWYTAKYIGKTLTDHKWPEGFRRVRTSRGWPPLAALDRNENWEWRVLNRRESVEEKLAQFEEAGYVTANLGSIVAWDFVRNVDKVFSRE